MIVKFDKSLESYIIYLGRSCTCYVLSLGGLHPICQAILIQTTRITLSCDILINE